MSTRSINGGSGVGKTPLSSNGNKNKNAASALSDAVETIKNAQGWRRPKLAGKIQLGKEKNKQDDAAVSRFEKWMKNNSSNKGKENNSNVPNSGGSTVNEGTTTVDLSELLTGVSDFSNTLNRLGTGFFTALNRVDDNEKKT